MASYTPRNGHSTPPAPVGGSYGTNGQQQQPGASRYQRPNTATFQIGVVVTVAGTPVRVPQALPIRPGDIVEVWPLVSNTKNVYVAQSAAAAMTQASGVSGPRSVLGPNTPSQTLDVTNLAQLFVNADISGEGLYFLIRRP